MEKKKKVYIIAGAAILAVAVIAVGYFALSAEKKPEEVWQEYTALIEAAEYEEMYEMLDEHSHKNISREDFIDRNRNIYEGIEAENIKVEQEEWDSNSESLSYLTTMNTAAGKIAFPNRVTFYKEDREWKIRWNSQLIHPALPEKGKVHVKTLTAVRGEILDRNGKLLAGEGTVFSVGLVPGKMDDTTDLSKMADLLGVSKRSIEKKLDAKWVKDGTFVPIRKMKNVDRIQEELLELPGVAINTTQSRVYPLEEAAAHLTGYVQDISAEELEQRKDQGYSVQSVIGKSGLEALYEDRLHGKNGCKIYITNEKGVEIKVLAQEKASDGEDITTTIDVKAQRALYEEFKEDNSCSVAMNPKTGEVLALVSTPAFAPSDFTLGMTEKQWNALNKDKDNPMYNRFRAAWCPGSSLKPIVGAMAMTANQLDPGEDFGHSGLSWQKDKRWGNYKVTTLHKYSAPANLKNALIYSDNIYFAKLALKMGEEAYCKSMEKLAFGKELPFPIKMKTSQYVNEGGMEDEIQLADSGYGQGQVLINPLHLASLYTAFVNDGNVLKPQLEQTDKQTAPAFWIEQAFSKTAASTVKKDLIQVIEDSDGTGHGARIEGITLAGKTGTAELKASKEDAGGQELGWFTVIREKGDNPLLLVTMVENVRNRGGSTYVVKKEKNVLEELIR